MATSDANHQEPTSDPYNGKPLVTHIYTADPSAHYFPTSASSNTKRIYIYPSHDIPSSIPDNDNGDQYAMNDYHVLSLASIGGPVTDHGPALSASSIPWVSKQLWAPDAAHANGKYYLFFPARDHSGIFRIGVAISSTPEGPFTPEPDYIPGTYSIDPAVFIDSDGAAYLYFGGLWGGQLQCWSSPSTGFNRSLEGPREPSGAGQPALFPRVAKLSPDLLSLASPVHDLQILDAHGTPLAADDHDRRFFEAAWLHTYNGKYYFSYSTGDTHYLAYAMGESPWGPFTYAGRILEPVVGWTTHHSVVEVEGRWWLFYHDASLSGGENHLRSVKVKEIRYDAEGRIVCMKGQ